MTQFQVSTYRVAAQVQVAIFHTYIISPIRIILYCKWRRLRFTKHRHLLHQYLNITCIYMCILITTLSHFTHYLNHILTTQFISLITQRSIRFLVKYQLRNTISITQIHKSHPPHLPSALHPTRQSHFCIHICNSQITTSSISIHYM